MTSDAPVPHPFSGVPALDGELCFDQGALDAASADFGRLVRERPAAVLRPGSARDVATMVRYCREHGLKVAGRGQGHSTNGQAQVPDGVVVELGALDSIEIRDGSAVVGAGVRWSDLLRATLTEGLTPPAFTDYLELSVGGTLTAGGLGGQIGRHGTQTANVTELEVVTGEGEITTCSATERPDLFRASLGGLGQCGIITRATLRLVPAPRTVRHYVLMYPTVEAITAQQTRLIREGRFDYLVGQALLTPDGWTFMIEAAAYDGAAADDARLTDDLGATSVEVQDVPYFDFVNRLAPAVEGLKAMGEWQRPHPWLDTFLPAAVVDSVVSDTLAALKGNEVGATAVILLYPVLTATCTTPLPVLPDGDLVYLFSLLKTASPGADSAEEMVAANRRQYDVTRAAGGCFYPIGSVPLTKDDWIEHFGPFWPEFEAARHRYDPAGVLTPGQRIF
ncbi:FAD-binding protein [Streptomyces bambusae]|uniref:FAD-binding protein n=1 Tax=Streptomyces bambusae TaxID=1550616 RepID=UPI001CFF496E|nr:FAD-binding protein [Streptomyces bambusae]MCB5168327.1 FAD-binding protein [Streptomyces bambusae]